ncbi:MAG: molybdopterin dinucleotide binding domain-containing protein [Thermoleophilia bacterium]
MAESLILITGRTREQGIGMHKGKTSPEYRRATERAEMNPDDMARLKIQEGGIVRLRAEAGEVELSVQAGSLPRGLVFVPMGTSANLLVGAETQGTGMPSFKGVDVTVEPV